MERIDLSKIPDIPTNIKKEELEFLRFAYIKKDEYAIFKQTKTGELFKGKMK